MKLNVSDPWILAVPYRVENWDTFINKIVNRYPQYVFHQPKSYEPWTVRVFIGERTINFWPHKLKVQWGSGKARNGLKAMVAVIEDAIADEGYFDSDDIDVIEDFK